MSKHLGDFDTSAVIYGKFTTYQPSTGAAFTLGGTPALSVYKDNSVTQSTTGVTLTASFDSVTGLNHFAIDTSADGTFYSSGSFFDIVITTGTVDSVSVVGSVVGSFTLRKNSSLKPTTSGRTLDVSAGGEAGVDWANVGSPTTTVNLTGTKISTTQAVASVSGAVGSVTGNVGGNVTGSVGSVAAGGITNASFAADAITAAKVAADVSAEIADAIWDEATLGHTTAGTFGEQCKTDIDAILADTAVIGATGAGLTSLATQASVNTIDDFLDTEIAAIKAKTDSLTFTVAGQVDANIQSINDVAITGNGQVGTEFGV